jgi:hypothetical protein
MEFVENILNQAKDTTKITDGLNEITNIFKLPIQYNESTRKLNTNITAQVFYKKFGLK